MTFDVIKDLKLSLKSIVLSLYWIYEQDDISKVLSYYFFIKIFHQCI